MCPQCQILRSRRFTNPRTSIVAGVYWSVKLKLFRFRFQFHMDELRMLAKMKELRKRRTLECVDRAVCFEGDRDELDPAALLDFKSWNRR